MKKKKRVVSSERGIKYHIKHKSKLTSLLIIKILLMFFSFGIGVLIFSFINGALGQILSAILSFAIACLLYLFLIIKVLNLMKFK
jgi:hypothetical protein